MKNSNLRTGRCFVGALLIFTLAVSACGDEGSSASPLSVKMLYTYTGKGDRSYNDLAYEGLFRAMQAVTFEKLEMVPADHDQAGEILSSWLAAEASAPDLIIVISSSYADIMTRRDWDLNGHRMLYLDYSAPPRDGLSSVTYRTFAPSFIGGVSAARVSVTGTCSALGGMPDPVVDEFIEGFRQGVEHLSGDFLGPFYLADDESGFSQSGPARELALELREESGVDVIFPVAGGSGLGVIEAAKETDQTLFALGVDVDQSYLGPGVIIGSGSAARP